MKVVTTCQEMRSLISRAKAQKKQIGFAPTMGCLHEGHLSLISKSIQDNDITIVSIFVNPTQFGKNEDFDRYPRQLQNDIKLLEKLPGVTVVFAPSYSDIYGNAPNTQTIVHVPHLSKLYCGKTRTNFFDGVCSIVTRLFNLILPNRAYFGEKDFQQFVIIKMMTADLLLNINIIGLPIIREINGLAMSSRNQYLSKIERDEASLIYTMLSNACKLFSEGERDADVIQKKIRGIISHNSLLKIEYIAFVHSDTLKVMSQCTEQTRILIAGCINQTRLIDNCNISDKTHLI